MDIAWQLRLVHEPEGSVYVNKSIFFCCSNVCFYVKHIVCMLSGIDFKRQQNYFVVGSKIVPFQNLNS